MENMNPLYAAIGSTVGLLLLLDILIKSVVLVTVFWAVDRLLTGRISAYSRHLLWLISLGSLALIPFSTGILPGLAAVTDEPTFLVELTVLASGAADSETASVRWSPVVLMLYLVPVTFLLTRLLIALYQLRHLRVNSRPLDNPEVGKMAVGLQLRMGIHRKLTLGVHDQISSPVSFGLLNPHVILPVHASSWPLQTIEDVLTHEFSHIRRLDWLTMLFGQVIASVYWLNPLAWLALRRMHEEAEHSCDTAVLNSNRSTHDYAQTLLDVAKSCRERCRYSCAAETLMQPMLHRTTLTTRVTKILEDHTMQSGNIRKEVKKTATVAGLLSLGMLLGLSSIQVLSTTAQAQDRPAPVTQSNTIPPDAPMYPLVSVMPQYPTVAANEGIEGWVQVKFTVADTGVVIPESVEVVDAEPAEIFNVSAVRAARQFRFSPRVRNNETVEVPNVQYVFRYRMNED
jgi:bla regulator protein blaR1